MKKVIGYTIAYPLYYFGLFFKKLFFNAPYYKDKGWFYETVMKTWYTYVAITDRVIKIQNWSGINKPWKPLEIC